MRLFPLTFRRAAALISSAADASASAPRPRAAADDVLPFKATERTLANGLKVIVVPTGFPNLVSIQIPVQTGSRNEVEPGKSGFAHFFEHLMFRGTPDTPPREVPRDHEQGRRARQREHRRRLHALLRHVREGTSRDASSRLYADMFQHLSYSEADFKTEARAILGEYNKNSADPLQKLFEVQRERFFQAHTYKHTTMGFIADIENMPNEYEYSKVFFERWYRPQFTTIIVAGDVTPERGAADGREVLGRVEGRVRRAGGDPDGTGAEGAALRPRAVDERHAAVRHGRVSRARRSSRRARIGGDGHPRGAVLRLDLRALQEARRRRAEGRLDSRSTCPTSVDPSLFTVVRAGEEAGGCRLRARSDPRDGRGGAQRRRCRPQRLADAKSFDRYAFARTLDSTERIAQVISGFALVPALVRHRQTTSTGRWTASRPPTSRRPRASISPTPG